MAYLFHGTLNTNFILGFRARTRNFQINKNLLYYIPGEKKERERERTFLKTGEGN